MPIWDRPDHFALRYGKAGINELTIGSGLLVILGIAPNHDSGAVLIDPQGRVSAAINEGRLIGEKFYWGFPRQSVLRCLDIAGYVPEDITFVAIGQLCLPSLGRDDGIGSTNLATRAMEFAAKFPPTRTKTFANFNRGLFSLLWSSGYREQLSSLGITAPIRHYDHHYCHAASAYYTSPFDRDTLVLTMDGSGDFRASTVYTVDDSHQLQLEAWTPFYHSPGKFWEYITYMAGFDPRKDAGKISGLAAYGDPGPCLDVFERYLDADTEELTFVNNLGRWNNPAAARLMHELEGHEMKDVAAALQHRTETVVSSLVTTAMRRFNCANLALAGGIAANVKLNHTLLDQESVERIYVHPNMGDGGLGMGAAYALLAEDKESSASPLRPNYIRTVMHGTENDHNEVLTAINAHDLDFEAPRNLARRTGELLAKGYVVGQYKGQLEYGPRALGNRSILVAPTDGDCSDWLNERLGRTAFMPFAPSVLAEDASEYFENVSDATVPCTFMTITRNVTEKAWQEAPGIVHVDGTARPQLVFQEHSPSYHRLIASFKDKSGISVVLNTSFNVHGKPIINTPDDAIRAYKSGIVDALAIGNCLLVGAHSPTVGDLEVC